MQTFNRERLEFALDKRGFTQTKLAELLGITARQVRNYVKDEQIPDLNELANLLEFPVHFFTNDEKLPELKSQAVSFRARSRTSKRLEKEALNHSITAFLLNDWLETEFTLSQAVLPDFSDIPPEEAAQELRLEWGLGNEPITNMLTLLEAKGVRVFSLSLDTKDIDAFCTWYENHPFVFLNTQKSAERSRFDAAHELGHLIRDKYSMEHSKNSEITADEPRDIIEKEANAFASAFLMPEAALRLYRHVPITIENLLKIKRRFGVSLVALAYRMHKLGMITDRMYIHNLCPLFAKKKYRTIEPEPMEREISSALRKMLTILKNDGIGIEQIAENLNVSPKDVADLTFGLVERDLNRYRKLRLVK